MKGRSGELVENTGAKMSECVLYARDMMEGILSQTLHSQGPELQILCDS